MAIRILGHVQASFAAHRRFLCLGYAIAGGLCFGVALLAELSGLGGLYPYLDYPDCARRNDLLCGVMTLASGVGLLMAGLLFTLIGRQLARRGELTSTVVGWPVAGLGLSYLGADEILMLHERLTRWLAAQGWPKLFGAVDQDVYIFAAYGLLAVTLGARLLRTVADHHRTLFPLAAMCAFFLLSQAMDFVPWMALTPAQQRVLGPLEEITKTLGSWSAVLYGVLLLEEVVEARAAGTGGELTSA
jgi:hypothetical protein